MTSTKTDRIQIELPPFTSLPAQTQAILLSKARMGHLTPDSSFVAQGTPYPGLIVVLSGQLRCARINHAGKEQIFSVAGKGDCLGISGITGNRIAPFDILVSKEGDAVIIAYESARRAIERDVNCALLMLKLANERADAMQAMVDSLSLRNAYARLAEWLINWIENAYPEHKPPFQAVLPCTQTEIAARLGTVREVISRGFNRLQREGVLTVSGRRLSVLSLDSLRQAASRV